MSPLQKLPKIVEDLSKLIVAKHFKKSPKVQKIAKSGHTVAGTTRYTGVWENMGWKNGGGEEIDCSLIHKYAIVLPYLLDN